MFSKILIANRGEIACRVIRTCNRLGIATVAVYSDADRNALHVQMADEAWHIGGPRPIDSYLRGDKIIEVAKASGAEAIHPGYGFLSENAGFARAVEASRLVFIGPTPEAINAMGSKSAAKTLMEKAGVPVTPGYHGDNQEPAFLAQQANLIGYPLLIKAVAGGGGKGMRLVNASEEFAAQLDAAKREASNAFGDDVVLLERFVTGPHHIEFQVFGDTHGNVIHLHERECSIQRRHQKILEETPSPFLDHTLRARMGEAAVVAASAIGYRGAGTIEFIVGEDREFFFMEMNTRLQVEHPITEMITGQDLVEWQLRIAFGETLPLSQSEVPRHGHAIEVRLCAENPNNNFLPETGALSRFATPITNAHIRIDTGVVEGDSIGVFYDPMIAKLIVYDEDRIRAIRRLQQTLAKTTIIGVMTNVAFLQRLVHHPAFLRGDTDTQFIGRYGDDLFSVREATPEIALVAAASKYFHDAENAANTSMRCNVDFTSPWHSAKGWRLNSGSHRAVQFFDPLSNKTTAINVVGAQFSIDGRVMAATSRCGEDRIRLEYDGKQTTAMIARHGDSFTVLLDDARYHLLATNPFAFETTEESPGGRLTALMPGRIVKIFVSPGDTVRQGQPLLIMEAMKMEHAINSPCDGVVARISFQVDQVVEADAVLIVFAE